MNDNDISFESFIPTDKWNLQEWYMSRLVTFDSLYSRILRAHLSDALDVKSLISFFSLVIAYNVSAKKNMIQHMGEEKYVKFVTLIDVTAKSLQEKPIHNVVNEVMIILSDFHWDSGLSKLSESRATGTFGRARAKLGIPSKKGSDES